MSADTNTPEEERQPEPDPQVRLQKFLASAGLGSRRHCEEYITEGRVTIDSEVVTDLGVKVDPRRQEVHVDGERIKPQKKRYYLLNKPPGYVCTNSDPLGRPRAIDLVPQDDARLFTVGRLDESSRGLILVTNDGELAHRMAHPRFSISRRYQVQVAGKPTPETLKQLREGIYFKDGKFFVTRVHPIKTQGKSTILEIELHQGRNRELRRLLARVGHKVMSLERVTFGPLKLGSLSLGKFRTLRDNEMTELRELADKPQRRKSGKGRSPKGKPAGGQSRQSQGLPPKKRGGKSSPSGKPKRKRRGG